MQWCRESLGLKLSLFTPSFQFKLVFSLPKFSFVSVRWYFHLFPPFWKTESLRRCRQKVYQFESISPSSRCKATQAVEYIGIVFSRGFTRSTASEKKMFFLFFSQTKIRLARLQLARVQSHYSDASRNFTKSITEDFLRKWLTFLTLNIDLFPLFHETKFVRGFSYSWHVFHANPYMPWLSSEQGWYRSICSI